MSPREIVLPETKPETEWVRGRALQKMSPTWSHARLQAAIVIALDAWAGDRGYALPEWRFRLQPAGETIRPLVPDVAYVRVERVRGFTGLALESPLLAPDVAVEIRSPGDRQADIDDKVATYLSCGTSLVVAIDPAARAATLHDGNGSVRLSEHDTLCHSALPGFALPLRELFSKITPPCP
jgi:Uma2 family endonuclease